MKRSVLNLSIPLPRNRNVSVTVTKTIFSNHACILSFSDTSSTYNWRRVWLTRITYVTKPQLRLLLSHNFMPQFLPSVFELSTITPSFLLNSCYINFLSLAHIMCSPTSGGWSWHIWLRIKGKLRDFWRREHNQDISQVGVSIPLHLLQATSVTMWPNP